MREQTPRRKRERFIALGGQFEGRDWIAWKVVGSKLGSPQRLSKLTYRIGAMRDPNVADANPANGCAQGLNIHAAQPDSKIVRRRHLVECRVSPDAVACVPHSAHAWRLGDTYTAGPKFRVQRLRVVASYKYVGRKLVLLEIDPDYELVPEP